MEWNWKNIGKIEYFYEQILFNLLKYSNFIVNKILIRYEALLRIRLQFEILFEIKFNLPFL